MTNRRNLCVLILSTLIWTACTTEKENTGKSYSDEEIKSESEKANAFFEKAFNQALDRSPMYQSYLGIKKDYGKWDDISAENEAMELDITKEQLQWLKDSLDYDALDKQTKISYELFQMNAENDIADYKWRTYNYPVNQMFGLHSQIPSFLINVHQVSDSSDAAAYISRLQGVGKLLDQLIENLKEREEDGIVPPKFVFARVIDDSQNLLKGAPMQTSAEVNTLYADFKAKVESLDLEKKVQTALIKGGKRALVDSVKPAYTKLIAFLKDQEQRATEDDGVWKFPEGADFYNNVLQRTTTTDLTSDEIHEIGLKEVERIHGEMRKIMEQVNFQGDLQSFFRFVLEDEQFYYPNTDEGKEAYLDSATAIIDNMREQLDDLFLTKPKADIIVKRVEAFREKSAGKAFYQSPAPDGSRPGIYYANLYDTKNMPKYEMEALAYHEGIPGHHMDRSISQELEGIPEFRKYGGYTAYVEGWGLYCEYIPKEMGMYQNPYADYGRLAMELWRACRLVVDTGIHGKKWTRQQGIDYYRNNTSGSERDCERMVERHIVMPSQAVAYKVGMLKILELREKAKSALGDAFDIREFHDVVLTSGAVPLNVLEKLVDDYIAKG